MESYPVHDDLWTCGGCGAENLEGNAPDVCPLCGHKRDYDIGCCTNPSEHSDDADSLSQGQHSHYPGSRDVLYTECFVLGPSFHKRTNTTASNVLTETYVDARSCNGFVEEHRNHQYQSPSHGHNEEITMQHVMPPSIATFGGAGSPGEGVWQCSACGEPNASFQWPQCGSCWVINE